jgi:hypothetical protein
MREATVLQDFIRHECCNHRPGGVCLGQPFAEQPSCASEAGGPCAVGAAGLRCAFFEKCVLPIADLRPKRGKGVVRAYHALNGLFGFKPGICACGMMTSSPESPCPRCGGGKHPKKKKTAVAAEQQNLFG